MATGKCPKCGSTRIDQYMMPYGPIWCCDCGFRVEDKTATPNPFLEADKNETSADRAGTGEKPHHPKPSLGAALYELSQRAGRQARAADSSEEERSTGDESDSAEQ